MNPANVMLIMVIAIAIIGYVYFAIQDKKKNAKNNQSKFLGKL